MISQDRMEHALKYLATTDEDCARAKAKMKGLEKQEKTIKAQCFLEVTVFSNVAERENKALESNVFRKWLKDYEEAVLDYELLATKRNTEATVIEVWRSLNASRRQGNI